MSTTDFQKHKDLLAHQLGGRTLAPGTPPTIDEMRRASAIDDEELLGELIELGIGPESVMLMSVAPLVAIAWCDGSMEDSERDAILKVAVAKGIVAGTAPYALLQDWLVSPPGEQLLETWESFVKAVIAGWDHDKADKFKKQLGDLGRSVASAAGGFMGLGAISAAEQAIIVRIEGAFDLGWR
jgi:hypothetical protein